MINRIVYAAVVAASLFVSVSCAGNAQTPTPEPTAIPTETPTNTPVPTQEPISPVPADDPKNAETLYSGTYRFDDESIAACALARTDDGTLAFSVFLGLNSEERKELLYATSALTCCAYLPESINLFRVMGSLSNGKDISVMQVKNARTGKWDIFADEEWLRIPNELLTDFTSTLDEKELSELVEHMTRLAACLNLPEDFE